MSLANARPVVMITTRNRAVAEPFYADTLGLTRSPEDGFAALFQASGTTLRLTEVPGYAATPYPVLGFEVADIAAAVDGLAAKGVAMSRYDGLDQDERGIWTAPGGHAKVVFFADPDGNVLSLTQPG